MGFSIILYNIVDDQDENVCRTEYKNDDGRKTVTFEVSVVRGRRSRSCYGSVAVACLVLSLLRGRGWNVPKHSGRRRLRPNTAPTADPHHGGRRRRRLHTQRVRHYGVVVVGGEGRGTPATTP